MIDPRRQAPADVPFVSGHELRRLLSPAAAAASIVEALQGGLDPCADPARTSVALGRGEFLLMPSQSAVAAGVKVVTVAPGNPARGLPRIQGLYLLFDAETLAPVAILDGGALTTVRTPAVPAALLSTMPGRFTAPVRLVVFGTGPQGIAHVEAIDAIEGLRLGDVTMVARRPESVALPARLTGAPVHVIGSGDPSLQDAVSAADVVVCATTARRPVFDSGALRTGATVIAVGSHEPDARELDGALLGRATVVVEDRATAVREAGDVVLAVAEGYLTPDTLVNLADVIRGDHIIDGAETVVLKTTGMAWEDLVVATAAFDRRIADPAGPA